MEAVGRAWVRAVAAGAGFAVGQSDFDRDGVDLNIRSGGYSFPQLDLQLKATTEEKVIRDGMLKFDLRKKNYDSLILDTVVPRVLVVHFMDQHEVNWVAVEGSGLTISGMCYWVCLCGQPPSGNTSTVRVWIPEENVFDLNAIRNLLKEVD